MEGLLSFFFRDRNLSKSHNAPGFSVLGLVQYFIVSTRSYFCLGCQPVFRSDEVQFSLDYKGLQPGMAAQPIGPNK